MWVQGTNLCKVYNCHACSYKRSKILPRLEGMVLGVAWYWIKMIVGIALQSCVLSIVTALWITLFGN
jgi:hypothetical protein